MAETDFKDLALVGVDEERTVPSPDHPGTAMYHVYLKLSARPPPAWAEFFTERRRFPRHSMWRRAWIEGQYLVVNCPIAEVEQHHLQDLKDDVKETNTEYRTFAAKEQQKKEAADRAAKAAEEEKRAALKKLKF